MYELLNEYRDFILENINSEFPLDEHILLEEISTEDAFKKISKAIKNMNYISIYYADGSTNGFRLLEPFVLGSGIRRGNEESNSDVHYLRAYQIKDTREDEYTSDKFKTSKWLKPFVGDGHKESVSRSGHEPMWRLFRVDRITRIKILNKKFEHLRDDYNPDDKMIARIHSSVPLESLKESKGYINF